MKNLLPTLQIVILKKPDIITKQVTSQLIDQLRDYTLN